MGFPLFEYLTSLPKRLLHHGGVTIRLGHLIVIALRTGKHLKWDPAKEQFVGEGAKDAKSHLARKMRKPYDYNFAGSKT